MATYGETIEVLGITWLICDMREIGRLAEQGHDLASLVPIDAATGRRLENVRIGRADRAALVNVERSSDGGVRVWATTRGRAEMLTDAQRSILRDAFTGQRDVHALHDLTPEEIAERYVSAWAAAGRSAAREAYMRTPERETAGRGPENRAALDDAVSDDTRARALAAMLEGFEASAREWLGL